MAQGGSTRASQPLFLAFVSGVGCAVLGLILTRGSAVSAAELELLVLRHERRVLRWRAGGAAWRPGDRLWPTALSRCLPSRAWHVVPVHPATLRRWHRGRVRGMAAARRVPRPPLRGTWSTAAAGAPPPATRVSRVRVPVAGGQRGFANEERRTSSPR
jgi:hypothetical protein